MSRDLNREIPKGLKRPDASVIPPPKPCVHKWVYIESRYTRDVIEGKGILYKRTDRFYCEKCLAEKDIVKEELNSEWTVPDWWKSE